MRIRDWRIPFGVLLLCALAEFSWGASPTSSSVLLPVPDPATYRDLQNLQQAIINPTISTGTAKGFMVSSFTATNFTATNGTITTKLTVPNGVAATDAAAFGQLPVFTNMTTYAGGVNGNGSISGGVFEYRQMGDVIDVWATYTSGIPTGTAWSMTLPVNINLTSLQNTQAILGVLGASDAGTSNGLLIFTDGSDATKVYVTLPTAGTAGGAFHKELGNVRMNNTDTVSVRFTYPK
jgi:hypothetical protein